MSNRTLMKRYLLRWIDNYYDEEDPQTIDEILCEAVTDTYGLRSWDLIGRTQQAHELIYDEDDALQVIRHEVNNIKEQARRLEITTTTQPTAADFILATKGESKMNAMANFGGDKFMDRLFRKAPGVVWDMMTGKVGVSTKEGIATFTGEGDDAQIDINLFDQFGMEVPAFAQSTPVSAVNVGDLIYFGSTDKPGWIIEKRYGVKPTGSSTATKRPTRKTAAAGPVDLTVAEADIDTNNVQFTLMKVDGQRTTWKPPKVSMLGMGADGVMVIRSLLTMLPGGQNDLNGMQGNMMMMMQMQAMNGDGEGGGLDMEKLMPLMLMGAMGGNGAGGNNMMQTMMMMQMLKGGGDMFGGSKSKTSGSTGSGSFNKGPFSR